MQDRAIVQAMKSSIVGKLPAGILDSNVEFFSNDGSTFAFVQGEMLPVTAWPQSLRQAVLLDMEMHPQAIGFLHHAEIYGEDEMITQYVKCRFSAMDNDPDVIDGVLQQPEYVECALRGSCPYEGRLCELLKAAHGTLTHREIEVLRLIPEGMLDKEIADKLGISPLTVGVYMKNLREKTGYKNKAELVRFAFEKNLI